jgi:hypothetical protein
MAAAIPPTITTAPAAASMRRTLREIKNVKRGSNKRPTVVCPQVNSG